ncbi:MAG TPA: hypothetical protein V6D05_01930 [Stenomitos sp.]
MIRITGNHAISFAASKGLRVNQDPGPWGEARFEVELDEVETWGEEARTALWVEGSARDFAHFLADEALDNLVTIGDAEILPLWYGPEGSTQIEIVYLTNHDYAVRDRPDGLIGLWDIVHGRDQLLERVVGLVQRAAQHAVA